MTKLPLLKILGILNHSRDQRNHFAHLILNDLSTLPELLSICEKIDEEVSCRAAWGLEFLCKKNLTVVFPHLDEIIKIASKVYRHQAVRPMAKIFEYVIEAYYKQKPVAILQYLNTAQREKITEICFDWLITPQKVASQAYAMTALYLLGTEFDWIHPELKIILENNYISSSAAYKARARMILKKIS
ncbi:adenylosuccinate lyase [Aquimarina sp. U1-2]|uniref:adenylosuccinate lyase n=1 Tax=Aquimarina sp. U1-2 TaxID=2823141 RepID=UPI001AECA4BE|nr:adenylosuccinate lyase [Aquimarina sp. U1-2]MBP2833993.1 adenylosuccinate lyase [Aquimarina sp. U1-2]